MKERIVGCRRRGVTKPENGGTYDKSFVDEVKIPQGLRDWGSWTMTYSGYLRRGTTVLFSLECQKVEVRSGLWVQGMGRRVGGLFHRILYSWPLFLSSFLIRPFFTFRYLSIPSLIHLSFHKFTSPFSSSISSYCLSYPLPGTRCLPLVLSRPDGVRYEVPLSEVNIRSTYHGGPQHVTCRMCCHVSYELRRHYSLSYHRTLVVILNLTKFRTQISVIILELPWPSYTSLSPYLPVGGTGGPTWSLT